VNPLIGGLLVAVGICVISFAVTKGAQKSVRRRGRTAVAESMIGSTVRMIISVIGVCVVFGICGRTWGVPCALAMIPLYLIELTIDVLLLKRTLLRTSKKESKNE